MTIAMNLKALTDDQLLDLTKRRVGLERQSALDVIDCLNEVAQRHLHLTLSHSSLHVFCVKELGYSDSEAYIKIGALRLSEEVPKTREALSSGVLSLTKAAQIQSFFARQKKRAWPLDVVAKEQIVDSLQGKDQREVQKELITLGLELGDTEMAMNERERVVAPNITELKIFVPDEMMGKLAKLRSLLSHKYPNASNLDLLTEMVEISLNKFDPERKRIISKYGGKNCVKSEEASEPRKDTREHSKGPNYEGSNYKEAEREAPLLQRRKAQAQTQIATQAQTQARTRYIPQAIRKEIWKLCRGRCQYKSEKTNQICGSTQRLQIEHSHPWGKGGSNEIKNLTLYCAAHNLMAAREAYGNEKMNLHLNPQICDLT